MSRRNQWILIGGLVGGIVGALLGWAYTEIVEDDDDAPAPRLTGADRSLQFRADSGDLLKLGIAVIPVARMLADMFAPVDRKR